MSGLAALLSGVILAILLGRALWVLRAERGARGPRGTPPGRGLTTIVSEYSSGLGGERMTIRVPRDPQDYARAFVPRRHRTNGSE